MLVTANNKRAESRIAVSLVQAVDKQNDAVLVKLRDSEEIACDMYCYPITFVSKNGSTMLIDGYQDTGAEISLICDNVLPHDFVSSLHKNVFVTNVNGDGVSVDLVEVQVKSNAGIVNGIITVGVMPRLCMPKNALFLIGNDWGTEVAA